MALDYSIIGERLKRARLAKKYDTRKFSRENRCFYSFFK